jgi:hypothetical protein
MLTNIKIALSVALVLATASAAIAAPKHAVRRGTTAAVPANAYLSFARHQGGTDLGAGPARASGSTNESCYVKIQDIGNEEGDGIRPRSYSCRR